MELDLEWGSWLLVAVTGFVSGVINTLAGSGSLISLPILMYLGLPAGLANGTNRIGILFQSVTASRQFLNKGYFDRSGLLWMGVPAIMGSVVGARISIALPDEILKPVLGVLMLAMFLTLVFKPDFGTRPSAVSSGKLSRVMVFFLIGVYGGFIQAGVGFFLLAGLMLSAGYDLRVANAWKVLLVFLFTPLALLVFVVHGQVDYGTGLILATGSTAGGWVGARLSLRKDQRPVRYFLMIFVLLTGLDMLGLFRLLGVFGH